MEVGIIGLGKFGLQLGKSLAELGHTCIGMDIDPAKVHQAMDAFAQVYEGDATNIETLEELKFATLNTVAVTIGNHLEASILTVLGLQELGVFDILVKASNLMHKKVLERLGITRVIQPEIDEAKRLALKLDNPGIIDLLPIGKGIVVQEAKVANWAGKSLREMNVRGVSNVLVAAVRKNDALHYHFVPDPSSSFAFGDTLLLIGYDDDIRKVLKRI